MTVLQQVAQNGTFSYFHKKDLVFLFFPTLWATQIKKIVSLLSRKIKNIVIMAAKKEIRSNNTYIISTDNTDNPKLGAKILSNGRESLFLDYYFGLSVLSVLII